MNHIQRLCILCFLVVMGGSAPGCVEEVTQRPPASSSINVEQESLVLVKDDIARVDFNAMRGEQPLSVDNVVLSFSKSGIVSQTITENTGVFYVELRAEKPGEVEVTFSLKSNPNAKDVLNVLVRDYDQIDVLAPEEMLIGQEVELELFPTALGETSDVTWAPFESEVPTISVEHNPLGSSGSDVIDISTDPLDFDQLRVEGLAHGSATITVEKGGVSAEWTINVYEPSLLVVDPSLIEVTPEHSQEVEVRLIDVEGNFISSELSGNACSPNTAIDSTISTWTRQFSGWSVGAEIDQMGRELVDVKCEINGNLILTTTVDVIYDEGVDVQAASFHSCGTQALGDGAKEAKCWGSNAYGQLGTSPSDDAMPLDIDVSSDVESIRIADEEIRQISNGGQGQCAVTVSGKLFCTGRVAIPERLPMLDDMKSWMEVQHPSEDGTTWRHVETDESHVCAIDDAFKLFCWGVNDHGQLGNGSTDFVLQPVAVRGEHKWSRVALGVNRTCGITLDQTLWCWGAGEYGVIEPSVQEVGDPLVDHASPKKVEEIEAVISVALGTNHVCALETTGAMKCWGRNNRAQLATTQEDTLMAYQNKISAPNNIDTWSAIAVGDDSTCGLTVEGTLYCWGSSEYGIAGFEIANIPSPGLAVQTPNQVGPKDVITRFSVGAEHACIARSSSILPGLNGLYCWGHILHHRTGHTSQALTETQALKVNDQDDSTISSASLNDRYGCIIVGSPVGSSTDGQSTNVRCFGYNAYKRVGDQFALRVILEPQPVEMDQDDQSISFKKIDAGISHVCGLDESDNAWCWGNARYCALGNCTDTNDLPSSASTTPVAVQGGMKWKDIQAGFLSTCGITKHETDSSENNKVKCWGDNTLHQVTRTDTTISTGAGDTFNIQTTPEFLKKEDGTNWKLDVTHLAMAADASCAIVENNTMSEVFCWGKGLKDDEGNGLEHVTSYGPIPGNVVKLDAGFHHFCALVDTPNKDIDEIYCWGDGKFGRVNGVDDLNSENMKPVKVDLGVDGNPISIATGQDHSCALVPDTQEQVSVICWGSNQYAQRGIAKTGVSYAPREIDIMLTNNNFSINEVVAGAQQTCALGANTGGTNPDNEDMYCWGARSFAQGGRPLGLTTAPLALGFTTKLRLVAFPGN